MYALREINRKVSRFKLQGRKAYYTIGNIRWVWARYEGRCADCGLVLAPTGYAADSVRFVHRVPLKRGGRIRKENLLPLCERHANDRDQAYPIPSLRVVDYNTFGDLVVQLVWATLSDDKVRIAYFKRCLDLTLAQFVQELHAIPIGLDEDVVHEPVEGNSTASEYCAQIVDKLAELFEEVGYSKQYSPTRTK